MRLEDGFVAGFVVLSFVVFVAGFLGGMLAVAVVPTKPDSTTLWFLIFLFGLAIGAVATAILFMKVKLFKSAK